MTRGVALIVLVGLAAAGARPAHAQEAPPDSVAYRVHQGDSLDLVAAEFYGDRNKALFIIDENKMPRWRALKPGEHLRIPISRDIVTAPGDTFESLAGTYLGNARRGAFLAELNAMSVDDALPAGTQLTIPFAVVHTALTVESLTDVARNYFGDGKNAELLRRYNFLDKPTLDRGDTLIVPGVHIKPAPIHALALDADAKARRDHRRDAVARAVRAVPAARQAWKDGDYAAVQAQLAPLDPELDYLDPGDAAEVGLLLGAADIAFDSSEQALALFKRVLDRQPHDVLKRYQYSPKILAVWQKAGGQIE